MTDGQVISLKKPHWWLGTALKDSHCMALHLGDSCWLVARSAMYKVADLALEHGAVYRVQARRIQPGDRYWYGYTLDGTLAMVCKTMRTSPQPLPGPLPDDMLPSEVPDYDAIASDFLRHWFYRDGELVAILARRDMAKYRKRLEVKDEKAAKAKRKVAEKLMVGMPI